MSPIDEIPDEVFEQFEDEYHEQLWQEQIAEKRKELEEIPINLIIDTNWWIYLTKEENFLFLKQIAEKLNTGEFRILVPEPIIAEWDRNLEQTKENAKNTIRNQTKNAVRISKFLEEPQKSQFKEILQEYREKETLRIDGVDNVIGKIDEIIKSKSQIIPISGATKDKVLEFGMQKKATFKSKNSTGDALIFFSAMEYLRENTDPDLSDSIFISYNSDDFSKSKSEQNEIHPDLEELLTETNTTYERNIAKALQLSEKMQEGIDDYLDYKAESALEDEYIEAQIDDYIQYQIDIARGK